MKIKQLSLTLTLALLLIVSSSPASALYQPNQGQRGRQEDDSMAAPDQPEQAGQKDQGPRYSITQEKNSENSRATRSATQAKQQVRERLTQVHATRLRRRFTFYYQRLSRIGEKIQNRINLIEDQGGQTQLAQEKLNLAFTHLESAQLKAEQAIDQFETIDPDQYQLQRQLALQAKDLAQDARLEFKTAKDAMIESIKTLTNLTINQDQEDL